MARKKRKKAKWTKLGLELEQAFGEMAAHLRGELDLPILCLKPPAKRWTSAMTSHII